MSTPTNENGRAAIRWDRRRFLQIAAAASGAALSIPAEAASGQGRTGIMPQQSHQALIDEPVLPEWAIGPFTRYANPRAIPYDGNPLISPQGRWSGENPGWESRATFNPGVIYHDNKFQMLYRGEKPSGQLKWGATTAVGYAYSEDGYHFTRYPGNPVIPRAGNADPRLYRFNGQIYAFYVVDDGIHVASSSDMIHWKELGTAIPPEKQGFDPALLADPSGNPVKLNGRYVMYYGSGNDTYLVYSDDLVHWTDYQPLNLHFPASYKPWEICITMTDYPTVQGRPLNRDIVMFVAGNLMSHGRWFYAITEVLFSRDDPSRQLSQLTFPIFEPRTPYEVLGTAFRCVWTNSVHFHQGQWWMYYGAGDHVIALAQAPLRSQEDLDLYSHFKGTGFETNQRQPDWVDEVDLDSGGGGIKNVGEFYGSAIGGPQAMVSYGYAPPLSYQPPQGIQDWATPYVRVFDRRAHSGDAALLYSGSAMGKADNYAYLKLFDLGRDPVEVKPTTKLSYWIHPEDETSFPLTHGLNSTHVALDVIFSDGTALRNLNAQDQHGNKLTPEGQGGHLDLNQWNYIESTIGSVAAGKRIVRIDVGYSQPHSSGSYRGFIDDIVLS